MIVPINPKENLIQISKTYILKQIIECADKSSRRNIRLKKIQTQATVLDLLGTLSPFRQAR